MPKPFLVISTRTSDEATADEIRSTLALSGLPADRVEHWRLESTPLPPLEEFAPERFAGFILGGSPFNASDTDKSEVQLRVEADLNRLLDWIVEHDAPFLGECYGVGTLGVHQGAVVDRSYPEPVGSTWVSLTETGRNDPLLAGLPESFGAYVGHKESISKLPPHAIHLATSPAAPVQMFKVKNNLYATQFHPELDQEGLITRIRIYAHAGYFPPEEAETRIEAAQQQNHLWPRLVLQNFVRIYGGDR
ncbi:glutamine amidotransferase [Neomicrococcus aestuarii]|uniref:Glutamine amidotransferase n=1 Tax=Neomicrococcus aestuarii TaxID=556325 RepID=A0A1L2ZMV2_9MICC|nr:glutamine amidotransferase [Neomicrococcus aestuarii]APF40714.1 glutamine amidotransferase [Neomicrococcus aestuarii]